MIFTCGKREETTPPASIPISKGKKEKSGGLLVNESLSEEKVVLSELLFTPWEGLELKEQVKNSTIQDVYFCFPFPILTFFEAFL